ncbi:MAG: hypothetical protein M3O30_01285 [Planctomycetota bacterium]|nr:hypothetical protein [Planctomycetota bacterium]
MICLLAELVLDSPRLWPVAAAVALGAVVLVGRLYLPQVRLLAQPWRAVLPALRIAALLALAASIVKPVAVRPASTSEAGAILILVDRSRSMSIRDLAYLDPSTKPSSSPAGTFLANASIPATQPGEDLVKAHLVSVADGLGLLRAGARDPALALVRDDITSLRGSLDAMNRARSEFNFARLSDQGLGATRTRTLESINQFRAAALKISDETAAFANANRAPDAFAQLWRIAHSTDDRPLDSSSAAVNGITRWADDAQAVADARLYESDTEVRAACDRLSRVSRFGRVEMALTQPATGLLYKIPGDVPLFGFGIAEDIQPIPLRGDGQPVRRLLAEPTGLGTDLLGGMRAALDRMAGQNVQAIVVLSDGRQTGPPAYSTFSSLASLMGTTGVPLFFVYCAPEVPLHDVAINGLVVPATSFVGDNLTARVELHASDIKGEVIPVSLAIDAKPPTTRLIDLADTSTTIEFPLQFDKPGVHHLVASIPSRPDSPTEDNKHIERWIKVLEDKVNVGIYAGDAGWDFQYVSNALARASWANLNRGILSEDAKLNLSPEQILDQGVLVLFDVPVSALSDAQWEAVYKLAVDRGGSVILVAGEDHLPLEYGRQKRAADLLPYFAGTSKAPVWRNWPGKDAGFHFALDQSALDLDALKLRDDIASDEAIAELTPFFRYFYLPELKPAAHTLVRERDSQAPLLVENRVGSGRVFFMGMNETWRWRRKVGERDQDRFWLQLVRYASEAPYATRVGGVWLDASAISIKPGESIHIRARVQDSQHNPSRDRSQTLRVTKGGAVVRNLTLTGIGNMGIGTGSGKYEGTLMDLPAGDYQLRLAPTGSDPEANLDLHVAPSMEEEMANLTGSAQPLRRLAETSGGAYLTLGQIRNLPDLMNRSRTVQSRLVQKPIWDSVYLYSFVVACFAAEWAIRKRVGLI